MTNKRAIEDKKGSSVEYVEVHWPERWGVLP